MSVCMTEDFVLRTFLFWFDIADNDLLCSSNSIKNLNKLVNTDF